MSSPQVEPEKCCVSGACPESNPQPLTAFHKDSSRPDGYHRYCKTCRKMQAGCYTQHKKEYDAQRYSENRAAVIARVNQYFAEHRAERLAAIAAWKRSHPNPEAAHSYRVTEHGRALGRKYSQQRRARLAEVAVEDFSHEEIYERDGWICQLCLQPVDSVLVWPDRLSASLDHVIPLCFGGEHSRANTQLAHLVCNIRKGREVVPGARGTRIEIELV